MGQEMTRNQGTVSLSHLINPQTSPTPTSTRWRPGAFPRTLPQLSSAQLGLS